MKVFVQKMPWWLKWKGLLGTKAPKPILFKTRFGIHTIGLRYPIDVVILDSKDTVKKLKENLLPNKIFFWNPLYENVLELPAGTIRKKGLKVSLKIHLLDYI